MAEYGLPELPEELIEEVCGRQDQEMKGQDKAIVVNDVAPQGSKTTQTSNHVSLDDMAARYNPMMESQLSGRALWGSALLQNYIHNYLKKNRVIEQEVGRLAAYIGVNYDHLLTYLNAMYPLRGRMLLNEEN